MFQVRRRVAETCLSLNRVNKQYSDRSASGTKRIEKKQRTMSNINSD